jgi:hypothetical protein
VWLPLGEKSWPAAWPGPTVSGVEDPTGPRCPLCNEDMTWVLGTETVPEPIAHWLCPEGDEWSGLTEPSAD